MGTYSQGVLEGTAAQAKRKGQPQQGAHHAPLSMGFSRQEYWSGLPFPTPGDLPDPGIESVSPALQVLPTPQYP